MGWALPPPRLPVCSHLPSTWFHFLPRWASWCLVPPLSLCPVCLKQPFYFAELSPSPEFSPAQYSPHPAQPRKLPMAPPDQKKHTPSFLCHARSLSSLEASWPFTEPPRPSVQEQTF